VLLPLFRRAVPARGARRAGQRGAAYYYLRIVKVMYFDEPAPLFDHSAFTPRAVLAFRQFPAVLLGLSGAADDAATAAAKSLF